MEDVDSLSDEDKKVTPKKHKSEKQEKKTQKMEDAPKKKRKTEPEEPVADAEPSPSARKSTEVMKKPGARVAKVKPGPKPKGTMRRPAAVSEEKSNRCYRCFYKRDGVHGLKMNNRQVMTVLASSFLSLCVVSLWIVDAIVAVLILLKVKPRDGVPDEQLLTIADTASDVHKLVESSSWSSMSLPVMVVII